MAKKIHLQKWKVLSFEGANSIETALWIVTYALALVHKLHNSLLQLDILCHLYFCHNRRNGFSSWKIINIYFIILQSNTV